MYFPPPDHGDCRNFGMENHVASVKAYLGVSLGAVALLALPACSKKADDDAAPAAATAGANAAAPAVNNTDTLDGSKFASFTGDAAAGEKVFLNCKTCHSAEAGKNMVGPSLHGLQGRTSGQIPGYAYSAANKVSGIVWTNEILFQYLESPQRVIPGTKMTYTGLKDPQQRANLIAYLDTLK